MISGRSCSKMMLVKCWRSCSYACSTVKRICSSNKSGFSTTSRTSRTFFEKKENCHRSIRSLRDFSSSLSYLKAMAAYTTTMTFRSSPQKRFFHSSTRSLSKSSSSYVETLMKHREEILLGGGEKAILRHTEKNKKILARDRIRIILDEDSEFLELAPYAAWDMYGGQISAAGIVAGIGRVQNELCVILANDATVKGGTLYPISVKKQVRVQEIAMQNDLPVIYLVDSGGAFLPLQDEIFPDRDHGGRVFYNEALMSASEIPSLSVVCGSCTAGGAYVPAMSDESVIVDRVGTIFLGGPPLVKAATGEVVSAEDLGGADIHCTKSGLTDHFARDEMEALEMAREIVGSFNTARRRRSMWDVAKDFQVPSSEYLSRVVSSLPTCSSSIGGNSEIDMKDVVSLLVDSDKTREFKPRYGSSLFVAYAQIEGHPVGIIANANQKLCAKGCRKGAQFVQLCSQRQLPLIFLQNVVGFEHEANPAEVLKTSATMLQAVARSDMPKITLIVGDSMSEANYPMCGRSQSPNFLFTWPNARIRYFDDFTDEKEDRMDSMYCSARVRDDGVILPEETRRFLGASLEACRNPMMRFRTDNMGVFRM